jgi:hypothetical protein
VFGVGFWFSLGIGPLPPTTFSYCASMACSIIIRVYTDARVPGPAQRQRGRQLGRPPIMRGLCVWWRLEAAGRPQLGRHGAEFDDTNVVEHRPLTDEIRIAHIYGVAIARCMRPEVGVVELGVIRH